MEVIPLILDEKDVIQLGIEYVSLIAQCSTNTILEFVKVYLNNPNTNTECRSIVEHCYLPLLNQIEFENADDTKNIVQILNTLTYESIHAGTPNDKLAEYKDALDFFLNCSTITPYTSPIRVSRVNELLDLLKEESSSSSDVYGRIYNKLKKYKAYFRDALSASAKGTIFKNLCRNREMLSILRDGIDFLEEARTNKIEPKNWRHL